VTGLLHWERIYTEMGKYFSISELLPRSPKLNHSYLHLCNNFPRRNRDASPFIWVNTFTVLPIHEPIADAMFKFNNAVSTESCRKSKGSDYATCFGTKRWQRDWYRMNSSQRIPSAIRHWIPSYFVWANAIIALGSCSEL